jgi:dipeptidyl aminopeptidase/acylaminoacyl peptidase
VCYTSLLTVPLLILLISLSLNAAPLDRIAFEGSIASTRTSDERDIRAITYIPSGKGPHPVILALPSESGSQSDAIAVFRRFIGFANLGYAVVAPDITGSAIGGAELDDTLAWLDYIDRHERLDRNHVIIVGCSHGAYLAALTASRDDVYALILAGGFYDLDEYMINELKNSRNPSLRALYDTTTLELGAPLEDSGIYSSRSPMENADAISAHVLMFHSRRDGRIDAHYSQEFADALESAGREVDYYVLDSMNHDIDITGDDTAERVTRFLKEVDLPSETTAM